MTSSTMDWTIAIMRSLRSQECPSCRMVKRARQSLCGACYKRLPRDLKTELYRLVGEGYEEAMADALRHLGTKLTLLSATGLWTEIDPPQP